VDGKPPEIEDLADAVLDGQSVDWDHAETSAGAEAREAVHQLRVVAGIAGLHRAAAAEPALTQWGRLRVLEAIGVGSFGEVYRAWDTKLDREVALKLLRTDGAAPQGAAVLEEARLLARVRHPNVATVFDADEIDGRVGLWMEFIHGRTLEQILTERERLDDREVVRIGIELSKALAAVHEAGLLHRDIKAQNLMQSDDGRLVLMDFGTGWDLEGSGAAVLDAAGTPLYLAPEIFGGAQPTAQSDIYSAGVLLFHLLTGSYPVRGRSIEEVRSAHLRGERLSLATQSPRVPRSLASAIGRAIEPEQSKRFSSASEMLAALETARRKREAPRRAGLIAAGFGLAATLMGLTAWLSRPSPQSALAFRPRDWVLISQFENRTGDKLLDRTLDYALGLELSNSRYVSVVSRERIGDTLRLMKRSSETPIGFDVGREICLRDGGIRALLTGRVEKIGQTYDVRVELIDPLKDLKLASFSEKSDGRKGLSTAVQRISARVRTTLGETPARDETDAGALAKVTTANLRALQLYSEADSVMHGGVRSQHLAEGLLRRAVAEDPAFASAWIHLAWTLRNQEKPEAEFLPYAEAAMSLADTTTERERGFIRGSYYEMHGEREKAIAAYEELLAVYPDHDWAANNICHLYDWQQDPKESEKTVEIEARVADSRPNDLWWSAQAAMTALFFRPDPAREARFIGRASNLLLEDPEGSFPAEVGDFIVLQPFTASWIVGEVEAANREIDRIGSGLDTWDATGRELVARGAAIAYMTLGRLEAAAQVSRRIGDSGLRNAILAQVAFCRGDEVDLAARLKAGAGSQPIGLADPFLFLQARAGITADAERILKERGDRPPIPGTLGNLGGPALRGEIAVAEGRFAEAIREMQKEWETDSKVMVVPPSFHLSRESLATLLERQGDLAHAIQVLENRTERCTAAGSGSGPFWLRNRLQLAQLYRRAGRVNDARAVEAELSSLLSFADPDHPIKVELARLKS
jgi:serine/threonine-protein kinase